MEIIKAQKNECMCRLPNIPIDHTNTCFKAVIDFLFLIYIYSIYIFLYICIFVRHAVGARGCNVITFFPLLLHSVS